MWDAGRALFLRSSRGGNGGGAEPSERFSGDAETSKTSCIAAGGIELALRSMASRRAAARSERRSAFVGFARASSLFAELTRPASGCNFAGRSSRRDRGGCFDLALIAAFQWGYLAAFSSASGPSTAP